MHQIKYIFNIKEIIAKVKSQQIEMKENIFNYK